jgi:hypothetical protein
MMSGAVWPTSSSGCAPTRPVPTDPRNTPERQAGRSADQPSNRLRLTMRRGAAVSQTELAQPQLRRLGPWRERRIGRTIWPPDQGSTRHRIGAAGAAVNTQSRPSSRASPSTDLVRPSPTRDACGGLADDRVCAPGPPGHTRHRPAGQLPWRQPESNLINPATPEHQPPAVSDCRWQPGPFP